MKRVFKAICIFMCLVIVVSSVALVSAVKNPHPFGLDLFGADEVLEKIKNYEMNMTSIIYVKNDKDEWEEYQRIHGDENRIWVDIEDVPKQLIDAVVAIEDERFFTHGGVDWKRTIGAFLNYLPFIELYSSDQGGSTVTQQLIKNLMEDKEKSAKRKVREIVRALVIEKKLEKEDILEAYLNTISLGNGICGVQVAANYYFNKDVGDLTLTECAAIAGITKNPTAYNPISKPEGNKKRRQLVLDKMLELEKISQAEYNSSIIEDIVIDDSQQADFEIPVNSYFIDALITNISEDLAEKYGCSLDTATTMLYNGGYQIYASVDTEIQSVLEEIYLNQKTYFYQRSSKDRSKHVQSAMTVMDYQGHILGIVGGVGEKTVNRSLNRAYDSPRQPGSTMKPLGAYAPAIDNGIITYGSSIVDEPIENFYGDDKKGPKNSYGGYRGKMTVAKALEISANTIPCHIVKDMGIDTSYNFLTQKLGLEHLTEVDKNLASLALGGCQYGITTTESAAAYAIFGNGGKHYEPVTYHKVEKTNGELVLDGDGGGVQAIHPATAYIMNRLLQNVVYGGGGTGRAISGYNRMKAYAKTGTSSESNDKWMVAGTPYYVASVWCGFDQPERVNVSAATIWKTAMSKIHRELEYKEFEECEEVVEGKYCRYTGLVAGKKCYSTASGYFVPGHEEECTGKHTGSLASNSTSSEQSSSQTASNPSNTSSSAQTSSGQTSSSTTSDGTPSSSPDNSQEPAQPPETGGDSGSEGDDNSGTGGTSNAPAGTTP